MLALDVDYMLGLVPVILVYVAMIIGMALAAMVCAMLLACLMAVEPVIRVPAPDQFLQLFISLFRGTPLLVQLFLFYYGPPQILPILSGINGVTATIIGLTLHFSAYMAENIRDPWCRSQPVGGGTGRRHDAGAVDAADYLAAGGPRGGTNLGQILHRHDQKHLAAFTLGVTKMMGATQKEAASSGLYFEAFLVVAVLYSAIVETMSLLQKQLERHLNKAITRRSAYVDRPNATGQILCLTASTLTSRRASGCRSLAPLVPASQPCCAV